MTVIPTNLVYVKESPIGVTAGDVLSYNVQYENAVTIHGGAFMRIWKNHSTDMSSTMLSGVLSAAGNVLTLKTISFANASNNTDYTAVWSVTVNGQVIVRACVFKATAEKAL